MLLNDEQMFKEWIRDVKTMSGRIIEMREALYDQLVNKLHTPGDWKHITSQIGMFSFTGLNPDQCKKMVENAHIYMTGNGKFLKLPSLRILRSSW
jgi:aspartate aminotransferase